MEMFYSVLTVVDGRFRPPHGERRGVLFPTTGNDYITVGRLADSSGLLIYHASYFYMGTWSHNSGELWAWNRLSKMHIDP